MKKVNLSKLHKLISRLEEEIKEKQHDVRLKGSVRYTLKTADDKYAAMVNNLRLEQAKANEYVRGKIALLPYLLHLKHTLHTRNNQVGIDKLMIEVGNATREYNLLDGYMKTLLEASRHVSDECEGLSFEEIMGMLDAEHRPSIGRLVNGVNREDIEALRVELKGVTQKKADLEDEIARLNQTTLVEIPSREDFFQK